MAYAPARTRSRPGFSLLAVVYLVIGGIISATHHFWTNVDTAKQIISGMLAVIFWPLVLLGVSLHIH